MRALLIIPLILALLASCTTTKYVEVPVETVKIERIHDTKVDSVVVRDSIDRWLKGDTCYIYQEHTKYKYIGRVDTVIKIDTIPQLLKVETVKEVRVNYITWYQKLLMWLGGVLGVALIGLIIYKTRKK